MKYLKLYEEYEKLIPEFSPEIGDYVVIEYDSDRILNDVGDEVVYFVNNNVGEIVSKEVIVNIWYKIKYNPRDFINAAFQNNIVEFSSNHIKIEFCSTNKQEAEEYLMTRKYNI